MPLSVYRRPPQSSIPTCRPFVNCRSNDTGSNAVILSIPTNSDTPQTYDKQLLTLILIVPEKPDSYQDMASAISQVVPNASGFSRWGSKALLPELTINHLNPIRHGKLKLPIRHRHILPLTTKAIFRDRSVHFFDNYSANPVLRRDLQQNLPNPLRQTLRNPPKHRIPRGQRSHIGSERQPEQFLLQLGFTQKKGQRRPQIVQLLNCRPPHLALARDVKPSILAVAEE